MPPIFKNRQNPVTFISRSVAVVVLPIYWVNGIGMVPIGQRSPKMSNHGEWCLACGYLDWDESGGEAAAREIWEELGLDLVEKLADAQPWFVQSDPGKDDRQNVTLRFAAEVAIENALLPPLTPGLAECVQARWAELTDLTCSESDPAHIPLAFGQNQLIRDYLKALQA